MNINPKIINALSPLNIGVYPLFAPSKSDSYIVFYTYNEKTIVFGDDEPIYETTSGSVDIYTKKSYKQLLKETKQLLKSNGFNVSQGAEMYEQETGYYHVVLEISIENESEEI